MEPKLQPEEAEKAGRKQTVTGQEPESQAQWWGEGAGE